jgi:hypothetical protein
MATGKFRGYMLLTGLGFIALIGVGLFMFVQLRDMALNYTLTNFSNMGVYYEL